MKTLKIDVTSTIDEIVVSIYGRDLERCIKAVKLAETLSMPMSLIQEAIEVYHRSLSSCCAEKKQAEADYKALLNALTELETKIPKNG